MKNTLNKTRAEYYYLQLLFKHFFCKLIRERDIRYNSFSKMAAKVQCESSRQLGFALSYTPFYPQTEEKTVFMVTTGLCLCLFRLNYCVVIPLAKRIAGTTGKVEKAKECVVPRQRTEGGRRFDRFYVIICTNAMHCNCNSLFTSFSSHQVSIFTHMHSVHFSAFSTHYAQCTSRP